MPLKEHIRQFTAGIGNKACQMFLADGHLCPMAFPLYNTDSLEFHASVYQLDLTDKPKGFRELKEVLERTEADGVITVFSSSAAFCDDDVAVDVVENMLKDEEKFLATPDLKPCIIVVVEIPETRYFAIAPIKKNEDGTQEIETVFAQEENGATSIYCDVPKLLTAKGEPA